MTVMPSDDALAAQIGRVYVGRLLPWLCRENVTIEEVIEETRAIGLALSTPETHDAYQTMRKMVLGV